MDDAFTVTMQKSVRLVKPEQELRNHARAAASSADKVRHLFAAQSPLVVSFDPSIPFAPLMPVSHFEKLRNNANAAPQGCCKGPLEYFGNRECRIGRNLVFENKSYLLDKVRCFGNLGNYDA